MLLPQKQPQAFDLFHDVTEAQYMYYQWQIMKIRQVVLLHLIMIYSSPHLCIILIVFIVDHGISDTYVGSGWGRSTRII